MDPKIQILIGAVAAIAIVIWLLQRRRNQKGELLIYFESKVFQQKETVQGFVEVVPRENFQMNSLTLRLRCHMTGVKNGSRKGSNSVLVDQKFPLAAEKKLQRGFPEKFAFSFEIPSVDELLARQQEELLAFAPDALKGVAKSYLDFGHTTRKLNWIVVAELDAEGLDLWKNKQLLVK